MSRGFPRVRLGEVRVKVSAWAKPVTWQDAGKCTEAVTATVWQGWGAASPPPRYTWLVPTAIWDYFHPVTWRDWHNVCQSTRNTWSKRSFIFHAIIQLLTLKRIVKKLPRYIRTKKNDTWRIRGKWMNTKNGVLGIWHYMNKWTEHSMSMQWHASPQKALSVGQRTDATVNTKYPTKTYLSKGKCSFASFFLDRVWATLWAQCDHLNTF